METKNTGNTIIQHIQTDFFSLILRKIDHNILLIEWDSIVENYQIRLEEISWLRKAIQNYTASNGPSMLLIKTFNGIIVDSKVQKLLQNKEMCGEIRAVAIVIKSTTQRLSLNLSAQFGKNKIPLRSFPSQNGANKWLLRKQHLLN